MKILDKTTLLEQRVREGFTLKADYFAGDKSDNHNAGLEASMALRDPARSKSITMSSINWMGSEGHSKVWDQIEMITSKVRKVGMAAMLPDDLNSLIDLVRIDITRRIMSQADYTGIVGAERINPGFTKSVRLDEFLMPGAAFSPIKGNNDTVKLLEHKTGATGTVDIDLFAVGDKISLAKELFDNLYRAADVNEAVARGYVAKRNDLSVLGQMVAKTAATGWNASQQVAADGTSGATKMELLYNTLVTALNTLYGLNDPQTGKKISTPSIYLAIPKGTEFAFGRVMMGLQNGGKVGNYPALTQIAGIIPYEGDVIYMGEEKYTYPGVASGKAYLFVPGVANWTLVKRGLVMEQGQGSVLELSRQERAWYFAQGKYDTEFFGGSAALTAGTGYAVEISLPTL